MAEYRRYSRGSSFYFKQVADFGIGLIVLLFVGLVLVYGILDSILH